MTRPYPPVRIVTYDRDLRVTWTNPGQGGISARASAARSDSGLVPASHAQRLLAIKRRVLQTGVGERVQIEGTFRGVEVTWELIVEPMLDALGGIAGLTCVSSRIDNLAKAAGAHADRRRLTESELVAEILALVRRAELGRAGDGPTYEIGDVAVDAAGHGLRGPQAYVRLTRIEWLLLLNLLEAGGRMVSHEGLLSLVWGPQYATEIHLLHDTISRLRLRLRTAGIAFDPIETMHGVGYRLRQAGDEEPDSPTQ